MYVLGIDAGGTKTHCVIADENENILAEGFAGASQHQLFGIRQTEKNLQLAVSAALKEADLLFRISPTLCLVCQVLTVKMILPC